MFARFDENPAMTLRVIKETKRYGRTDGRTDARTDRRTDGRTDGQRENSIPPTNKVCGGYNKTFGFRSDQVGMSCLPNLSAEYRSKKRIVPIALSVAILL